MRDARRLGDLHDRGVVVADLARRPARPPRAGACASAPRAAERAAVDAGRDGLDRFHADTSFTIRPRSSSFSTLPMPERGSSSRKRTPRGTLKRARRARQCSSSSSSSRGAPAEHDERRRRPRPSARPATRDDGRVGDGRMLVEDALDLGRVDVLAARDVHVLEPRRDPVVALLVALGDVAGEQPAVGERGRASPRGCASSRRRRSARARRARPRPGRRAGDPTRDRAARPRRTGTACPRSPACARRPRPGGRARSARPR